MKYIFSKQEKKSKTKKIQFYVFLVFGVIALFAIISSPKKEKEPVKPIYEQFEVSEEIYNSYLEIFSKCGISKITKVEKDDTLNNGDIAYYIEVEGVEPNKVISPGNTTGNIIYVYKTQKNEISEISVNFIPVYKNGKYINKISAYTKLDVTEKTTCQIICEENMKSLLKSPSTAQFCKYSEYQWSKENGIIKAQGYVDAQNSFGAMIRSTYLLTYDCVKNKAISLNVDGKIYKFN